MDLMNRCRLVRADVIWYNPGGTMAAAANPNFAVATLVEGGNVLVFYDRINRFPSLLSTCKPRPFPTHRRPLRSMRRLLTLFAFNPIVAVSAFP